MRKGPLWDSCALALHRCFLRSCGFRLASHAWERERAKTDQILFHPKVPAVRLLPFGRSREKLVQLDEDLAGALVVELRKFHLLTLS